MSAPKFVTFLAWRAGTISRYDTGESPPIKAGRPEATPHLATAWKESNTIRETYDIFSEVWEKSAAVDSAEPNSKRILLHLHQLFVDAEILLTLCRGSCFLSYTAENSHHLTAKIISKDALG